MMSCQEVTRLIASGELEQAGWRRRLEARFHLWRCRHCKCYARQVSALDRAARQVLRSEPEPREGLADEILKRCLEGGGVTDAEEPGETAPVEGESSQEE